MEENKGDRRRYCTTRYVICGWKYAGKVSAKVRIFNIQFNTLILFLLQHLTKTSQNNCIMTLWETNKNQPSTKQYPVGNVNDCKYIIKAKKKYMGMKKLYKNIVICYKTHRTIILYMGGYNVSTNVAVRKASKTEAYIRRTTRCFYKC